MKINADMTHPVMTPHLRQYRHNNDDSPGFQPAMGVVYGYEKEGTDREIAALVAERNALAAHVERLSSQAKIVRTSEENKFLIEVEGLLQDIEEGADAIERGGS